MGTTLSKSLFLFFLLATFISGCAETFRVLTDGDAERQRISSAMNDSAMASENAKQANELSENRLRAILYQLDQSHDDFKDISLWTLQSESFSSGLSFQHNPPYSFSVEKVKEKGGTYYWFIFDYDGDDWIFIKSGQSAIFLVDGKKIEISGDGSVANRDAKAGFVMERAFYSVDKKFLKKIASAKEVRLQVIGEKAYVEVRFEPEHLANISRFLTETAQEKP